MRKYRLLREAALAAGTLRADELSVPEPVDDAALLRVHTEEYLARVVEGRLAARETRRIGFPWSPEMVERSRRSVGGTLAACQAALMDGVAANLAGGTHHAFADRGEGFCVFNDAAVAARALVAEGQVERVLIVDCDVHQGNGTAAIFAGDESAFTFSIHGATNFPFHKESSDLDVALPDGTGDEDYLAALAAGLDEALDRTLDGARAGLAIYLAGADPYVEDRFGRLALTRDGLERRDRMVLERCRGRGLPVALAMAGGYAESIDDIVAIHLATLRVARAHDRAAADPASRGVA